MRKVFLFSVLVVVVTTYWACKDNGVGTGGGTFGNQSLASPYFPLAIGNWWELDGYELDSNGIKVPGSESYEYDTVTGKTSIGGYSAYILRSNKGDQPAYVTYDAQSNLISFYDTSNGKGQGVWQVIAFFSNSVPGHMARYYQMTPNSMNSSSVPTQDMYYGDVPITVRAGMFSAAHYRDTSGYTNSNGSYIEEYGSSQDLYFAKNVGIVSTKSFSTNVFTEQGASESTRQGSYLELVAYHVQ